MSAYLLSRLFSAVWVVLGVLTLVFFVLHAAPGDPVELMLGEQASGADREALRESLGLNLSVWEQYLTFLSGVVVGDWGQSIHHAQSVMELISARIVETAYLAAMSMVFALLFALPLGLWAAKNVGRWQDQLAMGISLVGISVPNFVLGPVMIWLFAVVLLWLPTGGNETPQSVILPAIALGSALAAISARMIRSSVLQTMQSAYIKTARAKGLSEDKVLWRHALRNAFLPVLTVLGLQLGMLLGGAVITEVVFQWPGIGTLMVEAIQTRDYPVVQGCMLVISLAYVGVNLLTDLAYAQLDPRVRLG